jgi:predicted CXXCH cytochrome family protein
MDGATATVGSVSIACLSCHDGTQAMDSVINAPGSGLTNAAYSAGTWTPNPGSILTSGELDPLNIANLSQDLTDDHPIGIQYGGGGITTAAPTAATTDIDFFAPQNGLANGTTVWWIDTAAGTPAVREKEDIQLYTRVDAVTAGVTEPFVECASCHDPHSENTTFLRISNDGSAVCLACHNK